MCRIFFLLFAVLLFSPLRAQMPVILLAPESGAAEQRAAAVLKQYLDQITGVPAQMLRTRKKTGRRPLIVVGKHPQLTALGFQAPPALEADAFFVQGQGNAFLIAGGGAMGPEYGVYELLERLGCRKYSPRDSFIPRVPNLRLPDVPPSLQKPAFPYRELHYEPAFNEAWARWHRLKTRADKKAEWGLFVHTFEQLCPAREHFTSHPEYFAWNGAQRSPGQLCLSNDTVLQIVKTNLQEKIRQNPAGLYWSVSQNDNYDYCKCPRCAASDTRYGSPAGTLLAFVNAVAAAFPDKTISTLAYQYTRRAPRGIAPASNVSVCLCSIECNRGLPIEEGCTDFARDVAEWPALTHNLMIWDYVVQFRSYVSPFPNWHTLQPNLQLFQRRGVRMIFEQGTGADQSEFSDMRAYLLAKLMWNPNANMDSILTDFGQGYYGAAQPALRTYIQELTAQMKMAGQQLWIYGIPQSEPFLRGDALEEHIYTLFQAKKRLGADTFRLRRLLAARLPIEFARLEVAKTDSLALAHMLANPPEHAAATLRQFAADCRVAGFRNLHESGYPLDQYVQDYTAFLEKQRAAMRSRAYAPILAHPATPPYAKTNPAELTNRRIGETDYRYNWLGFQGNDLQVTVQVAGDEPVTHLGMSFLQDQASWVFFPEKVVFEISSDGIDFQQVYEEKIPLVPNGHKAVKTVEATLSAAPTAHYVRVTAVNTKTCPPWHTCNGNPCWIFADEVVVR